MGLKEWEGSVISYSHLQLYCRQRISLILCSGPKDSLYLYNSVLAGNGSPFSKSFRGHISIFDVLQTAILSPLNFLFMELIEIFLCE